MQLSEHLVRLGFTLPLSFPTGTDSSSLSARNVLTTDTSAIAHFQHTVQVARSVVELSKRDTMIQVSQGTLADILSKIKALEAEVDAMLKSQSSGAVPAVHAAPDASGGAQRASNDDCAPEKLLMDLGAGAIKTRDVVGEHPLFRRTDKCNYSSVTGSTAKAAGSRPKGAPAAPAPAAVDGAKAAPSSAAPSAGPSGAAFLEQTNHAAAKADPATPGDLATDSQMATGDDSKVHLGGDVYPVESGAAATTGSPTSDALLTVTVTSTRKKQVTVTVTTTRTKLVSITGAPGRENVVDPVPTPPASSDAQSGAVGDASSQASVSSQVSDAQASASGQVSSALASASGQVSSAKDSASSSQVSSAEASVSGQVSSAMNSTLSGVRSKLANATSILATSTPTSTPTGSVLAAVATPKLNETAPSGKAGLLGNIAGAVSSALGSKGPLLVTAQGNQKGGLRAPADDGVKNDHNATHAAQGKPATNPKSDEDKKDSKAGAAAVAASPVAPTGGARLPIDGHPTNGTTKAQEGKPANPKSGDDKKDSKAGSAAVTATPKRGADGAKAPEDNSSGFITVSKRPGM